MAEPTIIQHIEFEQFKEVSKYYLEHEAIRALGEDWGIIRIEYPKGIYDNYYIFAAISRRDGSEVNLPRAIILVRNCSKIEKGHIDEAVVEKQPGVPALSSKEAGGAEGFFEEGNQKYVKCGSLDEVLEHFNSNVIDLPGEEWDIYRLNCEEPDYPNCYIFLAVNLEEGEEVDVPRAVLLKSQCSPKDEKVIESLSPVEYVTADEEDEESDEEPSDDSEGGESSEKKSPSTHGGHTLH